MTGATLLERFVEHGVLSVFDRELALALGELANERSEPALLAAAFASAAVQAGHTCVDLWRLAGRRFIGADGESLDGLALPPAEAWKAELTASPLVMPAAA